MSAISYFTHETDAKILALINSLCEGFGQCKHENTNRSWKGNQHCGAIDEVADSQ